MWIFYAFLASICASLVAIFGKLGLKDVDPTLATTIRALIMAFFLIAVSVVFRKFDGFSLHTFSYRDWILIASAGIAGALSWIFYFIALKNGPASGVAVVDRTSVVFVIILAALFLGESLTWKSIIGGCMIAGGAILMVFF